MFVGRRTPEAHPVRELSPSAFRRVMDARPGQRVEVLIQCAPESLTTPGEPGPWWDYEVFSEGLWGPHLRRPSDAYLTAVGQVAGAAFVRAQVRSVI